MRLEQRRLCRVPLEPVPLADQLELFLAKPLRPLRGLLNSSRLQYSGGDLYNYRSSPYAVAGWTLQPRVSLRARLIAGELLIEQVACRVDGMGEWQERLRFGLEARLRPAAIAPIALEAEALVWAELPGVAVLAAAPVLNLALQQLLDRLERRCQQGLRRRAEAWFKRAS